MVAAQPARLKLRMQKELKILLTDPPPGASFPLLPPPDSDFSSVSLSSLLALIQGPEDTVYAKGVFKIHIQIPERYPFQPPIVTFATPIYHPNIDNGGRICLDILNLPPKGAWQPSLNISTVLISIGLLLSEPNPDDGLMCEASKEYKYNRRAFDQKARSLTEKYAQAGAVEIGSGSQSIQTESIPSLQIEAKGSTVWKHEISKDFASHKKLCGIGNKLSSECLDQRKGSDEGKDDVHILHPSQNQKQIDRKSSQCHQNHENLHGNRCKLSQETLCPSQMAIGDERVNAEPHHSSDSKIKHDSGNGSSENLLVVAPRHPFLPPKSIQNCNGKDERMHAISEPWGFIPPAVNNNSIQPQRDSIGRNGNGFSQSKHKKLGLTGRKLSWKPVGSSPNHENDDKENVAPIQNLLLPHTISLSTTSSQSGVSMASNHSDSITGSHSTNVVHKKCRIGQKGMLQPLAQLQVGNDDNMLLDSGTLTRFPSKSPPSLQDQEGHTQQDNNEKFAAAIKQGGESPIPDTVIVMDSEESEEERDGSFRSRLSLARNRLPRERKSNV